MVTLILVVVVVAVVSVVWTLLWGAPWVPSRMTTVHDMLDLAEVGPGDVVYDLGCGDGRVIVSAARRYEARAVGIEIDPLRYAWCRLLVTVLGLSDRVEVAFGDFFGWDLGGADVVICYLLQDTNQDLLEKLRNELPAGARVVSNRFTFVGMEPERTAGSARLYLFDQAVG